MSASRVCAREGCNALLEGMRSHARFCGPICRSAARRAREAEKPCNSVSATAERLPDGRVRLIIDLPEELA